MNRVVSEEAIKAGDLLFRIDPRTYQEALDKATAEAIRTQADYERGIDLVSTNAITG